MSDSLRKVFLGSVAAVIWVGSVAALLTLTTAPAAAFSNWAHDGIPPGPAQENCDLCHANGISDVSCTGLCHRGFKVTPGAMVDDRFPMTCWSCHRPGQDTSSFSSPSSACSQDCHLYNAFTMAYSIPSSHGAEPHLGASPPYGVCLDCHSTSQGPSSPGASPHHDGLAEEAPSCTRCHDGTYASAQVSHDGKACIDCHDGMDLPPVPSTCTTCHEASTFGSADCRSCHADEIHNTAPDVGSCTSCHSGYQKHAGALQCTTCHTNTAAFHHATATPAVKSCRTCHAMKHAGEKVSGSHCADCHKGGAPAAKPAAQHSSSVTKKYVCSGCHSKKLHAKARGASTTCRSCHKAKYHGGQGGVTSSACTKCHSSARSHAGGRPCLTCHKSVVHDPTPTP
jgi:hypothetical protein